MSVLTIVLAFKTLDMQDKNSQEGASQNQGGEANTPLPPERIPEVSLAS